MAIRFKGPAECVLEASLSLVEVKVTPRASATSVKVDGELVLVRVTAAPTDGQANSAVQELLAKKLKIAKGRVLLVRGETARQKVFEIEGLERAEILQSLRES